MLIRSRSFRLPPVAEPTGLSSIPFQAGRLKPLGHPSEVLLSPQPIQRLYYLHPSFLQRSEGGSRMCSIAPLLSPLFGRGTHGAFTHPVLTGRLKPLGHPSVLHFVSQFRVIGSVFGVNYKNKFQFSELPPPNSITFFSRFFLPHPHRPVRLPG